MDKALKIAYLNYILVLMSQKKLNEILINEFAVVFKTLFITLTNSFCLSHVYSDKPPIHGVVCMWPIIPSCQVVQNVKKLSVSHPSLTNESNDLEDSKQ